MKPALLTTALLLSILVGLKSIARPFDGPDVYYHDPGTGIVINRIDGRHRQIVAPAHLIGRNAWFVGWSPSGQWLAWTTMVQYDQFNQRLHLWLSRADGSEHRLVDANAVTAFWSSSLDQLLVWDARGCSVVEPESGQRDILVLYRPGCPRWTPDGHYLYAVAPGHLGHNYRLLFWSVDGPPFSRYIDQAQYEWLDNGRLAYWRDGKLIIEDLSTRTQQIYRIPPPGPADHVDWSPDGQYALIYQPAAVRGQTTQVQLLSIADETLLPINGDQGAFYMSFWAPNSSTVFLAGNAWDAYQLDLGSRRLRALGINAPMPTDVAYNPPEIQWLADGDTGYLQVVAEVYRYHKGSATLRPEVRRVYVSPGGEDLIVLGRRTTAPWIENTTSGERFRLDSRLPRAVYSAAWSPGDEWLLIQGSDATSNLTWVTDRRGRIMLEILRRDDHFTFEVQAYWLPDQVR